MNNKDYILIIVICVGSIIWMDYSYDKSLNKSYHENFKDREFNLGTYVNLPDGYNKGFMAYRLRKYNETWVINNNISFTDTYTIHMPKRIR